MLVSELANDADVLMTRVAFNEALYLRREAPPKSPPEQRIVIFDAGIRMWGVPRLLGTAVVLALGANADKASEVKFLRAEGDQLGEVPLENREHLIGHLEVLRHEAHVGDALSQIAQLVNGADGESAMILVTARDAASDPEFQKRLSEAGLTGLHIATNDGRSLQFAQYNTERLKARWVAVNCNRDVSLEFSKLQILRGRSNVHLHEAFLNGHRLSEHVLLRRCGAFARRELEFRSCR